MKAVVTTKAGGPEVLEIQEVPTPKAAPGEVLIRVHATAINGADLLQRAGQYSPPEGLYSFIPASRYHQTWNANLQCKHSIFKQLQRGAKASFAPSLICWLCLAGTH